MIKILCFGGSVTYGAVDQLGGWVAGLRVAMEILKPTKKPLVYNLGISGDTTRTLRKRFTSEMESRVSVGADKIIVIFGIGGNDAARSQIDEQYKVEIDEFRANINFLANKAKLLTSTVIFLGIPPVNDEITQLRPKGLRLKKNEFQRPYNAVIKDVCRENKLNFICLDEKLTSECIYKTVSSDGVHPTRRGHQIIADSIISLLVCLHLTKDL